MIRAAVANDFKLAILEGVHQPQDTYMMALYNQSADLNEETLAYTPTGEVQGPGYKPGGLVLTGRATGLSGSVGLLTWANPVWPNSTLAARGALVYNLSKSNRAVAVIDLGKVVTSTNGEFTVNMPPIQDALIQIG